MGIRPVGDRVKVRELPVERISTGGIALVNDRAEAQSKRPVWCEVLAIGNGEAVQARDGTTRAQSVRDILGCPLVVGDHVLVPRHWGVHHHGAARAQRVVILPCREILAIEARL